MKVLIFTADSNALQDVQSALKRAGAAVLFTQDPNEVPQLLKIHGNSIDILIAHREALNAAVTPGLQVISKLKKDPKFKDFPILLTTRQWTDEQCAQHQNGSEGVNAYQRIPVPAQTVMDLIEAVTGSSVSGTQTGIKAPPPSGHDAAGGDILLEDHTGIFSATESVSSSEIRLDAPDDVALEAPSIVATPLDLTGAAVSPATVPEPKAAPAPVSRATAGGIEIEFDPEPTFAAPPVAKAPDLSHLSIQVDPTRMAPSQDATRVASVEDATRVAQGEAATRLAAQLKSARQTPPVEPEYSDDELKAVNVEQELSQMPYLFGSKLGSGAPPVSGGPRWEHAPAPARPMGEPHNMDAEALKKYLALREQDVAALSAQLKTAKEQWGVLESQLKTERESNQEFQRQIEELQSRYTHLERERSGWADGEQKRAQELEFQLKMKVDKARILEQKVHETADEVERIKDRVRMDIRKIRVREKELENRLEILKKDSEALIAARENKIVELKRKLDLNEFNMDLLQDKYAKEKEQAARLKERLDRAQRAMRVADGFLIEEEGEPKTRAG